MSSSSNSWQLGYRIKSAMGGTHFDHFLKGPMSHILQTFDSSRRCLLCFRNEPSPCTLRLLCPLSAHGSAAMSPSPCRVQRQKEMTPHCEGTFLQTALFPPVTGMIYDYHDTLMCRINKGPGNLEIWGWAWNTCKVLPFSHAVFPVFLLISPLLSLISLLPVVLHFSETPIRVLTHVLPPTGYVLTHLL